MKYEPQSREMLITLLDKAMAPELSYRELDKLVRARRRAGGGDEPMGTGHRLRLAIASDATTNYLIGPLSLMLECRGVQPEIFVLPYASTEAGILDPNSELAAWKPQALLILQSPVAIRDWPDEVIGQDDADVFCANRVSHVAALCRTARERLGCEVFIDNWHAMPLAPHGSLGRRLAGEQNSLIRRMNRALDSAAAGTFHVHDVESIAAAYGTKAWVDWRLWFHAKQPMAFDAIPHYVRSLAALVASVYTAGVKCVVVDLDNTLWGGVIGDDGVRGIRVRQGDAGGEAYLAFQTYLLRLRRRGIVLAICSKNSDENARLPFLEIEDMKLRLTDFVVVKANWNPKPQNIREIAEELNLGLESFVFVDDNPVERQHVRTELPMVKVVELPDDPADYPYALDRTKWFEVSKVSNEDVGRTRQYQDNAQRQQLAASAGDYQAYLRTLEQRATLTGFRPDQLERIAQLINKTNQFNLTTRRVSGTDVEELARRDDIVKVAVRLEDRFGDNGLIAVCYGVVMERSLLVTQWLMSCRVFNRGVEQLTMNRLVEIAASRGLAQIVGEYRPTKKNNIVQDLYPRLGFTRLEEMKSSDDDAAEFWRLDVSEYRPFEHTIEIDTVEK